MCSTQHHDLPLLATVDETAALLRTSRKAVYAMIERRQLPGVVRIGRRVLIRTTRFATLAAPEVHAIAGKVNSDERDSQTVSTADGKSTSRSGWPTDRDTGNVAGFGSARSRRPQRWGQDRERHLLLHGLPQPKKEVPTLKEFAPRFLDGHARANRQKPSGIAAKEVLLRVHLVPFLGQKQLDAITNEDVQRLKRGWCTKAPKTVNNALAVLSVLLKKAVEWDVIDRMPCTIRLLRAAEAGAAFHDFEQYERLVEVGGRARSADAS